MGADPDYELFVRIVELGSVSAGGRALGLSAPTASRNLARLEGRLGVQLLNRTTRKVVLTTAGHQFHEEVLAILAAIRDAEARLLGQESVPSGYLKVSAPTSFGRMHIAPYLKTFLVANRRIEFELDLSDEYSNLLDDRIDVAVRIARQVPAGLRAHPLGVNRRVLCAAPAYLAAHGEPKSIRDLRNHAVLAAKGQMPWQLVGPRGPVGVDLKSLVRTNSSEVVRELALAGVGVALRSIWDVYDDLAAGRLLRILPAYQGSSDVQVMAVHQLSPLVPRRIAAFIDFLTGLYLPTPPWERRLAAGDVSELRCLR
jgi:DNA-binding transcriptional LysR family regulator